MNDKGRVLIDTRLDLSKLPDDVDEASDIIEKRLDILKKKSEKFTEDYEKETGIKVTDVSGTFGLTQDEVDELNELTEKYNELKKQKLEIVNTNKDLEDAEEGLADRQQASIDRLLGEIAKTRSEYRKLKEDFEKKGIDIDSDEANYKLDKVLSKFNEIKDNLKNNYGVDVGDIDQAENAVDRIRNSVEQIKNSLNSIGDGIKKTIKKVIKWGLAVFSVRSAYNLIRHAASTLSQYNEDLKNKIEGIRLSIASALEPIVKKLVDWVVILLRYVNAISMALFKWDLFKNAKNMKSMSKSAKEIKNSLAGFDEMNMLSDSSSGGGGDTGGFNYDDLYFGEEKPGWIEWIEKNADVIKDFLTFVLFFGVSFKALGLFKELLGISNLELWGLAAALALTLKGIFDLVGGIRDFIKEPTWENFSKILKGLGEILIGIGIAMAIIWGFNPATWVVLIIGAVALLVATLIKYWDQIKAGLKTAWDWIYNNFIKKVVDAFNGWLAPIKQVIKGIKQIFEGDLKGGLTTIVKALVNNLIGFLNKLISGINAITTPIRGLIVAIGKVLGKNYTMSNIKIPSIPKLATGGIVNRPTYAQLGEGGYKEAVLPLDRNTEWMDDLVKKINANGGGTVNIYLDGRLIQRQMKQREEELSFSTNGGA